MKMIRNILLIMSFTVLAACATNTSNSYNQGISSFKQQNYQQAFQRLYPYAVQGNSDAQYAVGYMLYYGKAGAQDKDQGIEWIRRSALQGNALAEQALGIITAQAVFSPEKQSMSS